MPGIGWSELLVIAAVAIVVVGPKDLPILMRAIGRFMGKARALAREFQESFEEIAREAELEELRKENERLRQAATNFVTQPIAPLTASEETKLREATNAEVLAAEAKSEPAPAPLETGTAETPSEAEPSNITPFRGGARR